MITRPVISLVKKNAIDPIYLLKESDFLNLVLNLLMAATYNFELGEDRGHRNMNQLYQPNLTNNPYYAYNQQPLQPQTFPTYANSSRNPLHPISMPSNITSGQDLLLFRLATLEKNMCQQFDDIRETLRPLRDIADILQTVKIVREICTSTEKMVERK